MRYLKCDECGKQVANPWRLVDEEREQARDAERAFLHVEADYDPDNVDFCGWACMAAYALRRATESVPGG